MATKVPNGILIAIEGIDGAGKTTQTERLFRRLQQDGFDVVRTKEPTSGPWGEQIRASAHTRRLSPSDELSLFIKDRKEHVANLIAPALMEGKVVIVDRYYLSTVAYQGARGLDPAELLELNESFAPRPDLILLLEIAVTTGQSRIKARGDTANLFEAEDELERAAVIFSALNRPGLRRLNGELGVDAIAGEILYSFYEGPLALRMNSPVQGSLLGTERTAEFLRGVEQIKNDTHIAEAEKAGAVLALFKTYLP